MSTVPYFSTRDPGSTRPRLLLVSYHFAPRASAGALRWRKLSPYLHEVGWDLDVVTTPPAGPAEGGGLEELPPGVSLYPVPEGPGKLRQMEDGLADWIRKRRSSGSGGEGGGTVPGGEASQAKKMIYWDELSWFPRSFRDLIRAFHNVLHIEETLKWARAAEKVADGLAQETKYHGILSSAPPWSTIVAAGRLARRHAWPLILDYRDPWSLPMPSLVESMAHPLFYMLSSRFETPAIRRAEAVIMNTPPAERAMAALHPGTRFCTILNGVDEVFTTSAPSPDQPFRIMYAGTVYIDRDPRVLFRAVRAMVDKLDLSPEQARLEFIGEAGTFAGVSTEQLADEAGISDYFTLRPPMPRAELVKELENAAVLISLPQSTPWSTPSKIYEYMGFGGQLLIYADSQSSTAEILSGSSVIVLDPTDEDGTEEALTRCYEQHVSGSAPGRSETLDRFDREQRGRELQELLEDIGLVANVVQMA